MTRQTMGSPAPQTEPKSRLTLIVIAVSAALHVGFLGYASLQPAPEVPEAPTTRVQVMQYQHDEASESWTVMGRRWVRLSREKLAAR